MSCSDLGEAIGACFSLALAMGHLGEHRGALMIQAWPQVQAAAAGSLAGRGSLDVEGTRTSTLTFVWTSIWAPAITSTLTPSIS